MLAFAISPTIQPLFGTRPSGNIDIFLQLGDDALRARGHLGLHLLEVDTRANAVAIDDLAIAHGEHNIGAMA